MSYRLERFGTVTLPNFNPGSDIGTGDARLQLQELPGGGAFDMLGSEQAQPGPVRLSKRGTVHSDDILALETDFYALRALLGKRDRLYRWRYASGLTEWCWARLSGINGQRLVGDRYKIDLNIEFMKLSPLWNGARHGDGWLLDAGEYLDTGLELDEESGDIYTLYGATTNIVVNNGGNAVVRNAILRIIPGTDAITAVTITKIGETEITYAGTIAPSQILEIDCGAWSVKNNAVDDYDGLTYGSGHAIDGLLRLDPGDNAITIVKVGGNINDRIDLEYYDGWQ